MEIQKRFESHGQGHVFQFWGDLSETERASLLQQAEGIDLDELDRLIDTLVKGGEGQSSIDFSTLEPAPYLTMPQDPSASKDWQAAKAVGEKALREGKVAAFTVAGGQGTRLGYDGPKGTFPVTPIRNKSLFQVFAEKIQFARRRYGCPLPWYIMTSHINHEATESFFEENKYFGLERASVRFFKQGLMPAVDFEGRIILESKGQIAMSPDGHGGALRALERSGALESMERAGIQAISYFQVDNPLVQVIDPYFIGFHFQQKSTMSSKMLPKAYEKEKLGHFCILDGRTTIVEYSDMPDELVMRRDDDGQLSFRAGSIAIHVIDLALARQLASATGEKALPFHRADKKIPCVDANGNEQKPSAPNGIKFELFVFDALPFAQNPLVLETTRMRDFSPVKNAEGVDSPQSCRDDQAKLFRSWLTAAGARPPAEGAVIEVSPLYAVDAETFAQAWAEAPRELKESDSIYIE